MNKAQLADLVAAKMGLSKKQAEDAINLIFDTIISVLKSGGEVTVTGFGAFESRIRKGRTGVNPRNLTERIHINPVRVPKFKAGKTLKDALRESVHASVPPPAMQSPTIRDTAPPSSAIPTA